MAGYPTILHKKGSNTAREGERDGRMNRNAPQRNIQVKETAMISHVDLLSSNSDKHLLSPYKFPY